MKQTEIMEAKRLRAIAFRDLYDSSKEITYASIARSHGLSRERVRQLISYARIRLDSNDQIRPRKR